MQLNKVSIKLKCNNRIPGIVLEGGICAASNLKFIKVRGVTVVFTKDVNQLRPAQKDRQLTIAPYRLTFFYPTNLKQRSQNMLLSYGPI